VHSLREKFSDSITILSTMYNASTDFEATLGKQN